MWLAKWILKQNRTKAQMISYYREVFQKTYAGQYVLTDLCRHGCIDSNTFNPNSARISDFNEGKRSMALHILNTLGLNPNEFINQYHIEVARKDENDVE